MLWLGNAVSMFIAFLFTEAADKAYRCTMIAVDRSFSSTTHIDFFALTMTSVHAQIALPSYWISQFSLAAASHCLFTVSGTNTQRHWGLTPH